MKKKIIFLALIPILIIIIAFGISGVFTSKADSEGFVVSNGILVSYTGEARDVIIPNGVKTIGKEAFSGNPMISSVTIGDNVKVIDSRAFSGCNSLCTVTIGNGCTDISDSAFSGCASLTNLSIGNSLSKMGDGVFSGCTSLAGADIKSSSFLVKDGAIYNQGITELYQYLPGYYCNIYEMPDTVKDIHRYAFWGVDKLQEVDCSSSLSKIEDYAFANAKSIEKVNIYSPVTSIGIGAFDSCKNLKEIDVPISLTSIGTGAFTNVSEDLIFVCETGSYAYRYAEENGYLSGSYSQINIEKNEMPILNNTTSSNGTDHIDDFIEINHSINNGLYSLGEEAIDENTVISDTRVVSDKVFLSLGDLAVTDGKDYTDILIIDNFSHYGDSSISSYIFDSDVTAIGKLAFARSGIESVEIPEGITDIGYAAFYHCDKLVSVTIPSTVTNIEKYAFDHTPWYENWVNDDNADDFLVVGDGVLIGYKGSESNPAIPDNVKHISEGVFN